MESIELDHQQLNEITMADSPYAVPMADSHYAVPMADSHYAVPMADSHYAVPMADSHYAVPMADSHYAVMAEAPLAGPLYSFDAIASPTILASIETPEDWEDSSYQVSTRETPIKEETPNKEEITTNEEIYLYDTPLREGTPTKQEFEDIPLEDISLQEASDEEPSDEGASGDDDSDDEDEMFTKDNRCLLCLKSCTYNNRADHRRIHCLQGPQGVAVPYNKRCKCCAIRGEQCIVAKEPCRKGLNTVQCLKCISNHRVCSFKKAFKRLRISSLHCHPARLA